MRPFLGFIAYLAAAFLLAAGLAYPLHLASDAWINPEPFKLVLRVAMLLILIGLPWLLARYGVANRDALGYALPRASFLLAMLRGGLLGISIIAVPIFLLIALDVRVADPDFQFTWAGLFERLLSALLAGLAVAFIEETFFRGAMLSAIAKTGGWTRAILLSSLLYALVHFLTGEYETEHWNWTTAFIALGAALQGFAEPERILDSFIALFAVGMLLSLARIGSRSLALSIGMHAAWILCIKLARWATDLNPQAHHAGLVGDYDGIIGWGAAIWLGLLCLIVWIKKRRLIDQPPSWSQAV